VKLEFEKVSGHRGQGGCCRGPSALLLALPLHCLPDLSARDVLRVLNVQQTAPTWRISACHAAAAAAAAELGWFWWWRQRWLWLSWLVQVYYPYLLMNKKRYAGLLWTKPDKYDKMDSKVR